VKGLEVTRKSENGRKNGEKKKKKERSNRE